MNKYVNLKFKVYIEELERKIQRKILIPEDKTVADLAYVILATFNSLSYHLYKIKIDNVEYDCGIELDEIFLNENIKLEEATKAKLSEIEFNKEKQIIMKYDFGSITTFIIKFINDKEKIYGQEFIITEGKGNGMLDDVADFELLDIVKDTDNLGYSNHWYSNGYENLYTYDYRNYNLEEDNVISKYRFKKIKEGYEEY